MPGSDGSAGPEPDSAGATYPEDSGSPDVDYSLPSAGFAQGPDSPTPGSGSRNSDGWNSDGWGSDPGGSGSRWRGLDGRWRRLVVAGLAIALVSALIGGLLGGFIASRSQSQGTAPGYRAGRVPRAAPNRPADSVAGVAARVLPSVVMVRVNGGAGTGSGFVIGGGYVVTDNHVVTLDGHAKNASLQLVVGNGKTVPGQLVGRDTYSDIAVIKPARALGLPALPLGNSAGLAVGDPVIAFGAPLGLAGTVTSGIVSALNRPVQPGAGNGAAAPQVFLEAIQTDAPINPGNSGGPLVNGQGQVIGVNAAFDTVGGSMITGEGGNIGLGFAIPVNQVRRVSTELIRTGHASHAVIGALLNLKYAGQGAQIASVRSGSAPPVAPGGPAALAGLRGGDVVVGFGGQLMTSAQTLLDAIRSRPPGAVVRFTFVRHGQTHAATLRLGSAPSS